MLGRVIAGNFRITAQVGSGAMGTIYKAEQLSLGKTVVIKLLHRHLTGDPTLSKRFHREARAASLLNHPNCINVFDFGQTEEGDLYIAMEFIDGVDLAELVYADFPIDPKRVTHILKQVCSALDEAHANGVLHRDLKPENIMVEDRRNMRDFVRVLDFGIAKLQDSSPGGAGTFQTVAGIVCGTPEYMSPEQARGEELDGRSDLYALGVVLYQMLTNEVPFEADSALGVVTMHLSQPPRPPSQIAAVPAPLERLCLSLLEKDRDKRPPGALDVMTELERIDRELDAIAKQSPSKLETDRTLVEIRPIQLEEAEAHFASRGAAPQHPAVEAGIRDTVPGTFQSRAMSVQLKEAASNPNHNADTVPDPVPSSGPSGIPRTNSNLKLWLITVLVGTAVALGGWLIYRLVASPSAPTQTQLILDASELEPDGSESPSL